MEAVYLSFEIEVLKRSCRTLHNILQYLGVGYSIEGSEMNLVHID